MHDVHTVRMAPMDLGELEAFRATVEEGSFTAAAHRLGVSQPALSRRVHRLETELGATLLTRHRARVGLTPAGERVLGFATETLHRYEAVCDELAGAGLTGSLRIVASTTPGEHLVPELVARFLDAHPGVSAEVSVADSAAVAEQVLERARDVGFSGRRADDARLTHVPVARDEVVLAAPVSHPLAARDAIPIEALEGQRLIQREEGSGTQRTFVETLAARGLALPLPAASVSLGSTHAVLSAVDAGLGIGLVSMRSLAHHQSDCVTAVRLEGVPVWRDLFMVYETARSRPPHHDAFLSFASHGAREHEPAPPASPSQPPA